MSNIETLVSDIYRVLDEGLEDLGAGAGAQWTGQRDGREAALRRAESTRRVSLLGERIADRVTRALGREERGRWRGSLRLSNIGKPCTRQLWYEVNHAEEGEALRPATRMKFLFGDVLEEVLLYLAEEAGHQVANRQAKVKVNGVVGHIDATVDGEVVDVKSASSRSFEKFRKGDLGTDDFGYLGQIGGYVEGWAAESAANANANAQGSALRRGHFLAVDKQNGHITLMTVDSPPAVSARIETLREAMASDEEPVRAFSPVPDGASGNMKLGVACSYCPYRVPCWPGMRTFLYANGPRFLVHVEREPNVIEA